MNLAQLTEFERLACRGDPAAGHAFLRLSEGPLSKAIRPRKPVDTRRGAMVMETFLKAQEKPTDARQARHHVWTALAVAAEALGVTPARLQGLIDDAMDRYLKQHGHSAHEGLSYVADLDHYRYPLDEKSARTIEEDDDENQGLGVYYFGLPPGESIDPLDHKMGHLSNAEHAEHLDEHRQELNDLLAQVLTAADPEEKAAIQAVISKLLGHINAHTQARGAAVFRNKKKPDHSR